MPSNIVLDTSAIIAALEGEPGAEDVAALLYRAIQGEIAVHAAFVSLMEAEYISIRRLGPVGADAALASVEAWPISVAESDSEWRHEAAAIKARGGLSTADAWIAALALRLDAELVHKDKEFDSVPGLRSIRL